jgi:ABC-type uncharacterized transport system involved in gliding motility auxiliary subunit
MKGRKIISETGLLLAVVLAVAVVVVADNVFTSVRMDLTENRLFTLSEGTLNILRSLEEPIDLDFYLSRKTLTDYPSIINYGNRVRDLLYEYAAESGGMIRLTIIEPEPFSEAEDQAVASGLQGVPVSNARDMAYFGLVGTNAVDDERVIPFFQNEREASLEYDITKLIYNLAHPDKRVVGVITSLPMFGNPMPPEIDNPMAPQTRKPWAIISVMREFFEVRNLSLDAETISDDIDVLMVVHPKDLSERTLYAFDQYLLGGGKAMLFVDPMAEADAAPPSPQNPMVMPATSSNLDKLLGAWKLEMTSGKIVGDVNLAMRVQTRGARGPQESIYLPWLRLDNMNFNASDFSTNELNTVNIASAGAIERREDSPLSFTPLMETTEESMLIDSDRLMFQPDPDYLLNEFVPDNRKRVLAARLGGKASTAFPDGLPESSADKQEDSGPKPAGADLIKEGNINAILVADTDLLSDYMWIRMQNFFGLEIPQTLANNGDFVINALDNLSGNNDLISLRTRGNYSRPFTTVEAIRRQAEAEFRDQERQLQAKLDETEKRLNELQRENDGGDLILTPEQTAEIEKFRLEQINTRKELRNVQHELQKNIERLGTQLKFINIGLVPLLIAVAAVAAGYLRSRRVH